MSNGQISGNYNWNIFGPWRLIITWYLSFFGQTPKRRSRRESAETARSTDFDPRTFIQKFGRVSSKLSVIIKGRQPASGSFCEAWEQRRKEGSFIFILAEYRIHSMTKVSSCFASENSVRSLSFESWMDRSDHRNNKRTARQELVAKLLDVVSIAFLNFHSNIILFDHEGCLIMFQCLSKYKPILSVAVHDTGPVVAARSRVRKEIFRRRYRFPTEIGTIDCALLERTYGLRHASALINDFAFSFNVSPNPIPIPLAVRSNRSLRLQLIPAYCTLLLSQKE